MEHIRCDPEAPVLFQFNLKGFGVSGTAGELKQSMVNGDNELVCYEGMLLSQLNINVNLI